MDFENTWLNYDGSLPPTAWRNAHQQHSPSSYSSDTFAPASTSQSFPNYYCHNPLECSSCANYAPQMPNDVIGNNRHHVFHQHYAHGMQHNFFQPRPAYKPKMKGKDCYGPTRYQQHMRMHPGIAGPNMKTNQMKQNNKRKRKYHFQAKKEGMNSFHAAPQINGSNGTNEINLMQNSFGDVTDLSKCTPMISQPKDQPSLGNKEAIGTDFLKILDECCTETASLHYSTNGSEFQTVPNLTQPTSLNNPAPTVTEGNLNMESELNIYSQQAPSNMNNCTVADAIVSGVNAFENTTVTSPVTEGNNLPSTEYFYLSEELLTEAGNIKSDVKITAQGYLESAEAEHYALQTMFEGKDESGKEVIILITTPESQENNAQESLANSVVNMQCPKMQNDSEMVAVSKLQTGQGMDNAPNENEYLVSSVNDFCYEEIVETSNESSKTKENENSQNSNVGKIEATRDNQRQAKNRKFTKAEIPNSENVQHQISYADKMKNSYSPWNRSRFRNNVKVNNKLKWKARFQHMPKGAKMWALQRKYFHHFMGGFKSNNIVNDDVLEKMMTVILHRIGGNVMQSIYKTFQELIRIHNSKTNC